MDCSPLSMGFSRQECCHSLLQKIFPTQGSNPGLLHCRQILYHPSHQESTYYLLTHCHYSWGFLKKSQYRCGESETLNCCGRECKNGAVAVENSLAVSLKVKCRVTIWPSNFTRRNTPKRTENMSIWNLILLFTAAYSQEPKSENNSMSLN